VRPVAWVLNLDADVELAAGTAGKGYTPSARVREAMRPWHGLLATELLGPDDVLVDAVDEGAPPPEARGRVGRAYCPTPRALALLRRAGAEPEPHPALEILRRVNSRAFCASLGATLEGAAFVTDRASLDAALREVPRLGVAWRIKRALGMAGRGQRVVAPGPLEGRSRVETELVEAGLADGGFQLEPDVRIERELAMHGFLEADGALTLGALVVQTCDARGGWVSSARAADDDEPEARGILHEEAKRVAAALLAEGYAGPFGIDAFHYLDREGVRRFQPRSEINARYSMGFACGFGPPPPPRGR